MAFTFPFCYTPRPEIMAAARRLSRRIDADPGLKALFAEGKMLGVLMVEEADGSTGFLYGFSGLAGGRNRVDGFVPPILDLLAPDGHFKQEEARIVALTRQMAAVKDDPERIAELKRERRRRSIDLQEWIFDQALVSNARGERLSIAEVFARRGLVPPGGTGECAAPKLLQHAYDQGLKPLALGEFWYGASPVGELRRHGSFYPACTGKCGPLLSFMLEGLDVEPDPLAPPAPFRSPEAPGHAPDARANAAPGPIGHTPHQDGPQEVVPILYEDDAILVIDKPSGLLSAPGRANPLSVLSLLEEGHGRLYSCHRLDMDTSGLMVFAKTPEDQAKLQAQFAARTVRKTYRARLMPAAGGRGLSPGDRGWIDLPIGQDWLDRPRQKVDRRDGKPALTAYEVLSSHPDGTLEVRFTPHTGRTHQLRVHAAHPDGLGRPIVGDRLYGGHTTAFQGCPAGPGNPGMPLQLRADTLSFLHPRSGERLDFDLGE